MHRNPTKSEVGNMTGTYSHTIDVKGRLFIPAKLREDLGTVFYVTVAPDRCLSAYSSDSWDQFLEKFKAMPQTKKRKIRTLFAHAAKCELDAQGRILLPLELREYAMLSKDITIIGAGDHAEIWDAACWAKESKEETTPENIAAALEELEL